MRFRPLVAGLALLTVLSAAAALNGCSKDKATNPPTTTPESFDSGDLTGVPFTHMFTTTTLSTFGYRCKHHGGAPYYMTGTVIVDPSSANTSASVSVNNFAFSPTSVTVKPGSTVTWNLVGGTHTVTRP